MSNPGASVSFHLVQGYLTSADLPCFVADSTAADGGLSGASALSNLLGAELSVDRLLKMGVVG